MKRVSIQDIAKELNLSRNTISKAMKNDPSVADETKKRIVNTALLMGYNKIPTNLLNEIDTMVTKPRKIIVLKNRDIAEFWERIILGISDELGKQGCNMLLRYVGEEEDMDFLKDLAKEEVEGIICLSIFSQGFMRKLFDAQIPIVFYDVPLYYNALTFKMDAVIVEGVNSMYQITDALIREGRRKISFIGDISYCKTIFDRWIGFELAMKMNNIPLIDSLVLTKHVPFKYYYSDELIEWISSMNVVPDAVVCTNDVMANSVVEYFVSEGYRVPEDISVTGFDDIPSSKFRKIPLTTIKVNNEYIGSRLVTKLLNRISNPAMQYETICIHTEPVFRNSTK